MVFYLSCSIGINSTVNLEHGRMARGGHGLPKVSLGPARHALHFYALCSGLLCNGLMAVSGVAHLQGRRPAAVFYPFGHPTPYAYDLKSNFGDLIMSGNERVLEQNAPPLSSLISPPFNAKSLKRKRLIQGCTIQGALVLQ
jgi:hypothetical protein